MCLLDVMRQNVAAQNDLFSAVFVASASLPEMTF